MVLLAAAVCNKAGKAIISRQFVEMTRSRIEGLLASFPKLMGSGKQHTFVETESVRYVYQPLEKLYVLLITTKASNILEDLESLRLFARVVPEYCKQMEESEIIDQAFPLIFAFDECVALGYRESVNLAQIRTFTEMDSHEEKVHQAVRQTQEREAKEHSKKMAKELQSKKDAARSGKRMPGLGNMGSSSPVNDTPIIETNNYEPPKPSYTSSKTPVTTFKGMKLGSKTKDVESFVDQLKSEGQAVTSTTLSSKPVVSRTILPDVNQESVHFTSEEKINLTVSRDGGLQNMEVTGSAKIKIDDEALCKILIQLAKSENSKLQMNPHPNVDRKLFLEQNVLGLKNSSSSFPVNQSADVLRWRYQTKDESQIPLFINCWPNETNNGCDVNIEYDLEATHLELNDVNICIPLPSGVGSPIVTECEGTYRHDSRKNILIWEIHVIDNSNKSGSMEFSIAGHPDDFFPIQVNFSCNKLFNDVHVSEVRTVDGDSVVKFSTDSQLIVGTYEIV